MVSRPGHEAHCESGRDSKVEDPYKSGPLEEDRPWYALYVRSNFERIVSQAAADRGYESFLPTYRIQRRWSDRVKNIDVPLFPGYVFCRFDLEKRLPILTIPGVVHIVGNGKTAVPVDTRELAAVRAVVASGLQCEPWASLAAGQRVIIEQGPLAGLEGVFQESRRQCRLLISVTMLQRSVSVEIERSWVRPAGSVLLSLRQEGAASSLLDA